MIEERSWGSRLFDLGNYLLVGLLAVSCLLPLLHTVAVSFSGRAASEAGLVALWPKAFTLANYERVVTNLQFRRSFAISGMRLGLGVIIQIVMTALMAYPLSVAEDLPGRGLAKALLLFGMLFSGGLIPMYLTLRTLGLLNKLWVLVLPGALPIFFVIVLLNFFRGLPREMAESASIDGASHWQILWRIYMPLSLPSLATLTLFSAVGHWNAWFDGLAFILDPRKYPLQTYLHTTIVRSDTSELLSAADLATLEQVSNRSMKAAQVMFATLPILLVYPFLQRYFVKGLTLGSVKG